MSDIINNILLSLVPYIKVLGCLYIGLLLILSIAFTVVMVITIKKIKNFNKK